MALPKKGTRQIVVDDDTYRYQVRRNDEASQMLTIEPPSGKVQQVVLETNKVTPKIVETYIRKKILGK